MVNRTIVERTIQQAKTFESWKFSDKIPSISGQGIELAISKLRDNWELIIELYPKIFNDVEVNSVYIHHLRINMLGQLEASLKYLQLTTENLIFDVLEKYTIEKSKNFDQNLGAKMFLLRWRADLQNKKDQFNDKGFEKLMNVISTELEFHNEVSSFTESDYLNIIIESFFRERKAAISNEKLLKNLVEEDSLTFEYNFKELVLSFLSFFDIGKKDSEKIYHVLLAGIFNSFKTYYEPLSNQEAGHGRFDILLVPVENERSGIIFELKKSNSGKENAMLDLVMKAIEQVKSNEYSVNFRRKGITKYVIFAIVFHVKRFAQNSKS